jgi:hypothetical protein
LKAVLSQEREREKAEREKRRAERMENTGMDVDGDGNVDEDIPTCLCRGFTLRVDAKPVICRLLY